MDPNCLRYLHVLCDEAKLYSIDKIPYIIPLYFDPLPPIPHQSIRNVNFGIVLSVICKCSDR